MEPAPERERKASWKGLLKAQWEVLGATGFFTVEAWSLRGLVRYHVLFVMRLSTRMGQIARNLTDCSDGFLRGCR